MSGGFTVLAWVKPTSALLKGNRDLDRDIEKQLLQDFVALLGIRWNMDIQVVPLDDELYAFGVNNRFTVSTQTMRNALGDLNEHVDFLRGNVSNIAEELVNFKRCKDKWNVPEIVSESTSGWEGPAADLSSRHSKHRRT
nr:hypothetical protein [Psittaciform chaphamaparvovirus 4]